MIQEFAGRGITERDGRERERERGGEKEMERDIDIKEQMRSNNLLHKKWSL